MTRKNSQNSTGNNLSIQYKKDDILLKLAAINT